MKKIVIKIGSSITTTSQGKFAVERFADLAKQTKELMTQNIGVIFVVSGAVSCGQMFVLGDSRSKQLAAGIGQAHLIQQLTQTFFKENLIVAQMLLTQSDFSNQKRKRNIKKVIQEGLDTNIVLLLNENDVLDLNSFSGNDFLASNVAQLIQADSLLLLTDVNGVFDTNMKVIESLSHSDQIANFSTMKISVGGIQAKITAAQQAAENGIHTVIANGMTHNCIKSIILGNKHIGTHFQERTFI